MKIDDLVKLEKQRKEALMKIKGLRPNIIKNVKKVLPDVKIIQIKPVGSVTDKKLFREDSTVDVGVYVKSSEYESGMNKELSDKFKNLYDDINVIVFVIEDKKILTELRKVGYTSDYNKKSIILAPDGYVYIYDNDNMEEIDEILLDRYDMDIDAIQEETEEGYHSFIMGSIFDNKLYVYEISESDITSVFSPMIKKVVKELNLDGMSYGSSYIGSDADIDYEYDISHNDVVNANLKSTEVYHGTNSKFIMNILKKGIMPTKHTNFSKIFHKDKVFFTSKKQYAMFHAFSSANKNKTVPLLIKFKIPDISKIVLDYDIALNLYGIDHPLTQKLGYDLVAKEATVGKTFYGKYDESDMEEWKKLADKASLNTRAGIFGYTGRIPTTYITSIIVDPNTIPQIAHSIYFHEEIDEQISNPNNFEEYTIEEFKKAIQDAINDLKSYEEDL